MDGNTDYPEFIDPVKESPITGTILGFDKAPTKFAKECVITQLEVDGSPRSLWLTATTLQSQFARLRPKVGERVEIEYRGMRSGANAEYHDFRVTAPDRPPFEPDWDAIGNEELEEVSDG